MHRADVSEVVNACDAGREGELIFRFVYEVAGCRKPTRRLWISSMEEAAIKEGFSHLKNGEAYDALFASALCRAKADWLIGINATRLFSVLYNHTLNVGRVQTPTLKMLVDRDAAITTFKKEKYYHVRLSLSGAEAASEKLSDRSEADRLKAACEASKAVCTSLVKEKKTAAPPKLFDLTSLQREANRLFEDVSYVINKKDRIALVGKNGAGKSTMLKILAGLQQPTSGVVAIPRECTIGYLPQVMILSDKRTVMQEAELAFEHIFEMQADIERMNQQLAERTDYDSEEYHKLIDRFTHENERFLMMGGTNFRAEIERTLQGLGFSREDFDRSTSEFSGGWRMRIELAKLLLRRPDVLLLDEPTNHLDIESIQWLENFLSTRANAVVLVSHDRAFLNNVTTRTIEITCGQIYDYKVKYDEFVVLRKERREQQLRAYENQQKQIEDTEAFIERFRYKATKAVQVQSRIKQLEKIERI